MHIERNEYRFIFKDGLYSVEYPEPYYTTKQIDNGVQLPSSARKQPLEPGCFLIKIFNMDLTCLTHMTDLLIDALSDLELTCTGANTREMLDDIFINYRETIASYFAESIDINYCIESRDVELLSGLIAAQFYDAYVEHCKAEDLLGICQQIISIQKNCYQILESKRYSYEILDTLCNNRISMSYTSYPDDRIEECYAVRTLKDLFCIDTFFYRKSKQKICHCKFCNKYFVKLQRSSEAYCNYPSNNPDFMGKTCREYHELNSSYKDEYSELTLKAYKAQYKYAEIDHAHEADYDIDTFPTWAGELKKREETARHNQDISLLNTFIKLTRFKNIGLAKQDYSKY